MNVWANWLRPAPSYFDRITGIVEQLVELETQMAQAELAVQVNQYQSLDQAFVMPLVAVVEFQKLRAILSVQAVLAMEWL